MSFLREVLSLEKCALRCFRRAEETEVLNFMAREGCVRRWEEGHARVEGGWSGYGAAGLARRALGQSGSVFAAGT